MSRPLEQLEESVERAARRQVHDERTASLLGVALGVAFGICALTGMWSHLQQNPPGWFQAPYGPDWTYRVTQGLHVATGLATVPLLLAKLYSVWPQLLRRPAVRGPVDGMQRLALLPLVGGSIALLATGAANIARWYPWDFFFPVGHYWAAWVVIGSLLIHLAFVVPTVRRSLGRSRPAVEPSTAPGELTRRGLLVATASTAAVITVFTVGQTVPWLRHIALLAPRRPDIGPQGIPVNRTASAAGTEGLDDADYRLEVVDAGGATVASFTRDQLRDLPLRDEVLTITCVEGWSATATWRGVPVAEVMRAAGVAPGAATVRSAQTRGGYRSSDLTDSAVADPRCLLALDLNGEPLNADHGAPLRLIGPNRPGVLQTKWVTRLEMQ